MLLASFRRHRRCGGAGSGPRRPPSTDRVGRRPPSSSKTLLVALAPGNDPVVAEARAIKAEMCRVRSEEVEPFVSKSCYRSSARLLDQGHTSWQDLP